MSSRPSVITASMAAYSFMSRLWLTGLRLTICGVKAKSKGTGAIILPPQSDPKLHPMNGTVAC